MNRPAPSTPMMRASWLIKPCCHGCASPRTPDQVTKGGAATPSSTRLEAPEAGPTGRAPVHEACPARGRWSGSTDSASLSEGYLQGEEGCRQIRRRREQACLGKAPQPRPRADGRQAPRAKRQPVKPLESPRSRPKGKPRPQSRPAGTPVPTGSASGGERGIYDPCDKVQPLASSMARTTGVFAARKRTTSKAARETTR